MLFNKKCCCDRQSGFGGFGGFGGFDGCCNQPQMECPITEPTITKCVEKEFYHQVPHDCCFFVILI